MHRIPKIRNCISLVSNAKATRENTCTAAKGVIAFELVTAMISIKYRVKDISILIEIAGKKDK